MRNCYEILKRKVTFLLRLLHIINAKTLLTTIKHCCRVFRLCIINNFVHFVLFVLLVCTLRPCSYSNSFDAGGPKWEAQ